MTRLQTSGPPIFQADPDGKSTQFTKRDMLNMLFKHKAIIAACFLGVTLLVGAGLFYLPPTYVAEATLLIKTEQQGNPSFLSGIAAYREPQETDPSNRKIETEMEILAARPLAEDVVKGLGVRYDDLYHSPLAVFGNLAARYIHAFKESVLHLPHKNPSVTMEDTVEEFRKGLKIEPAKSKSADTSSNLIKVSLKAADAETAQKALDLLVQKYIGFRNSIDQRSGRNAYNAVKAAQDEAQLRVAESQQRLNKLLAEEGATAARAGKMKIPKDGETDAPMRNRAAGDQAIDMTDSATLPILKGTLTDLEVELSQTLNFYTDESEKVIALRSRIAALKKRITQEVQKNTVKSDTVLTAQRELKNAEDAYLDLKRKLTQISLFLEMSPTQNDSRVIIAPPMQPRTSEWKKTFAIGIIGALAGLLLGLAIAGIREYYDHTLKTGEDIETYLGLDLIGVVPAMRSDRIPRIFNTY